MAKEKTKAAKADTKGSKAKADKAETKEAAPEFKYGVRDLAELLGIKDASVRVQLRNKGIEKAGKSYGWNSKAELKEVADQLRSADEDEKPAKKEKADKKSEGKKAKKDDKPAKKAKTKKSKSDEDDDDEDD